MSQRYLFICVYPISWNCTGRQANDSWKYIPKRLSIKHRVLFYDSSSTPIRKRQFIKEVFITMRQYIRFSFVNYRPVGGRLFQTIYWFVLVSLLSINRKIIILSSLPDERVFNMIWWKQTLVVYDCTDQVCDMFHKKNNLLVKREEKNFIKKCNITFVNSSALYTLKRAWSPQVRVVPAGFPLASIFYPVRRVISKRRRTIVCIGSVSFRFDFDLLQYIIQKNPSYQFVFIGPYLNLRNEWQKDIDAIVQTQKKWNSLKSFRNVKYLDYRKRSEIQAMSKYFDIGIIPYDVSLEFNKYSNPVKFYDYLSMGLPVVTTNILELQRYKDLSNVRIAKTKREFNRNLRDTFQLHKRDISAASSIARENDIDSKIDIMLREILTYADA